MKITAVLLAGGESRRFGQDKASLPWNGRPLWQHQLETLRKIRPTEIFVSARTEPIWQLPDLVLVKDPEPARGPLGGLLGALSAMNGSHLLVLAIDMPAMTANYLQSLIEKCRRGCGIVPFLNRKPEPLAAIYPVETLPIVRQDWQRGEDVSLHALVDQLVSLRLIEIVQVEPEQQSLFQNINRAEDLAVAQHAEQMRANSRRAAR